jgi:glycosyltransferase involved in cell wall biosynthesis
MTPHLVHVFPAFSTGGPEVRTALLMNAVNGDFRHSVVALNGDFSGHTRLRYPEAVRFVPGPPRGRSAGYLFGLARLLRSLRPDLVLTYGWGGLDAVPAARLGGVRRVLHTEDGFLPDEALGQKWPRLLARRVLLRGAARLVCPSRTLLRIAAGDWWLPPEKVCYIPNGVDCARFAPATPEARDVVRRQFGCSPEEVVVGTVGQLRAEKNHERLLRAFARAAAGRPAKLLLVGDGPLRPELERRAHELGLAGRVVFTGVLTDPAECYRALDVFALSSDTEQMPIAVLEAMATGLPVVSTDVGDVRVMVSPENCRFVVPRGDDERYAAALAGLLADRAVWPALGQANREKCLREYSMETMVRAYVRLYRESLPRGLR